MNTNTKREYEKKVLSLMIELYCRGNHLQNQNGQNASSFCPECEELNSYARSRVDNCPFMETKSFCDNCTVHCFASDRRDQIRMVMRYSGPRMIFHHPVMAIKHLLASRRERKNLQNSKR